MTAEQQHNLGFETPMPGVTGEVEYVDPGREHVKTLRARGVLGSYSCGNSKNKSRPSARAHQKLAGDARTGERAARYYVIESSSHEPINPAETTAAICHAATTEARGIYDHLGGHTLEVRELVV